MFILKFEARRMCRKKPSHMTRNLRCRACCKGRNPERLAADTGKNSQEVQHPRISNRKAVRSSHGVRTRCFKVPIREVVSNPGSGVEDSKARPMTRGVPGAARKFMAAPVIVGGRAHNDHCTVCSFAEIACAIWRRIL